MINLFINYFEHKNIERKKELDQCVRNNLNNNNIKCIIINSDKRITYNYYFNFINKYTSENDINIISNLDIYFDETIKLAEDMGINDCYALARWDVLPNGEFKLFDRADSQDCWIFKGKIKPIYGDFYLGQPGCDNRIAFEIQKAGYNISNPSRTIKSYHIHNSNVRNYSRKDLISPPYLSLAPVAL